VKQFREFLTTALVSGVLIVVPSYLAILLALRGMKSLGRLARPLASLFTAGFSQTAETALAFLMMLIICLAIGVAVQSRLGRAVRERIETSVLEKIPAYSLVRDLTRQLAGHGHESAWRPALAEMGGGLMLAFIIEELADGRYTVFVPSVPSPVRGSVYVMARERVRPLNASFAQTAHTLSRWGSGFGDIVAGLESDRRAVEDDGHGRRRASA
jgi:uncharacterized membrane protein